MILIGTASEKVISTTGSVYATRKVGACLSGILKVSESKGVWLQECVRMLLWAAYVLLHLRERKVQGVVARCFYGCVFCVLLCVWVCLSVCLKG